MSAASTPHIQVLGFACPRCRKTHARIAEAASRLGVSVRLEKCDDPALLAAYRVMVPPGIVINGELVHFGGLPSRAQVDAWLKPHLNPRP